MPTDRPHTHGQQFTRNNAWDTSEQLTITANHHHEGAPFLLLLISCTTRFFFFYSDQAIFATKLLMN